MARCPVQSLEPKVGCVALRVKSPKQSRAEQGFKIKAGREPGRKQRRFCHGSANYTTLHLRRYIKDFSHQQLCCDLQFWCSTSKRWKAPWPRLTSIYLVFAVVFTFLRNEVPCQSSVSTKEPAAKQFLEFWNEISNPGWLNCWAGLLTLEFYLVKLHIRSYIKIYYTIYHFSLYILFL